MKKESHKWFVQEDGTKICSKRKSRIQKKKDKEQSFEEWSDEILDFNKSIGIGQKNAIHL